MTRTDAITILSNAAWLGTDEDRDKIEEAVRMAVEALQTEKKSHLEDEICGNPANKAVKMQKSVTINESGDSLKLQNCNDSISRQAAIDAVCKDCEYYYNENVIQCLKDLSSAQPEIIRCKDCKHGSPNGIYGCRFEDFAYYVGCNRMYADDYCSRAERRKDG